MEKIYVVDGQKGDSEEIPSTPFASENSRVYTLSDHFSPIRKIDSLCSIHEQADSLHHDVSIGEFTTRHISLKILPLSGSINLSRRADGVTPLSTVNGLHRFQPRSRFSPIRSKYAYRRTKNRSLSD